jgi:hypothetical protein
MQFDDCETFGTLADHYQDQAWWVLEGWNGFPYSNWERGVCTVSRRRPKGALSPKSGTRNPAGAGGRRGRDTGSRGSVMQREA